LPASFPQVSLPPDNPLTVEGVALGEKLFHDVRLSRGHAQSCASCHDPALAFSDRVALSLGVDGLPGTRNAMPLTNLLWSPAFAWDSAHPLVRDQARAALVNPLEMHADPTTVVRDLSADPDYRAAFAAAFGPATPITPDALFLALEQFLLTRFSADSKFDRVMRGQARFTNQEQAGHALFNAEHDPARGRRGADCFHCHGGALFTDFQPKNNGLDLRSTDTGRAGITGLAADHGKFKTPSLRNIALTSPYMHDGRLATLEAVIAHYDHGVRRSENLDPNLAKHPDAGLGLISDEQAALLAFLHTLTDSRLLPAAPAESPDSAPASY
jgi:cytochrome c peroxidase